jgi:hypothetical protein
MFTSTSTRSPQRFGLYIVTKHQGIIRPSRQSRTLLRYDSVLLYVVTSTDLTNHCSRGHNCLFKRPERFTLMDLASFISVLRINFSPNVSLTPVRSLHIALSVSHKRDVEKREQQMLASENRNKDILVMILRQ